MHSQQTQSSIEAQAECVRAQEAATEATKRYSDLLKKVTKDSENMSAALEKAISASVRLCVVAPTVNVHVADKKLRFQSK